jgi:hypothetical protein
MRSDHTVMYIALAIALVCAIAVWFFGVGR